MMDIVFCSDAVGGTVTSWYCSCPNEHLPNTRTYFQHELSCGRIVGRYICVKSEDRVREGVCRRGGKVEGLPIGLVCIDEW